ncbi:hypothetical protein QTP88_021620 [Uroleucon formosanum]
MFPGRLVSLRENITWPPRSPDLSPCDYFLWGYLKAEVFKHRPRTIEELKKTIREEISMIPLDMLAKVMENFRERLQMGISSDLSQVRTAFEMLWMSAMGLLKAQIGQCLIICSIV